MAFSDESMRHGALPACRGGGAACSWSQACRKLRLIVDARPETTLDRLRRPGAAPASRSFSVRSRKRRSCTAAAFQRLRSARMSAATAGQPYGAPHGAVSHTSDGSAGLQASQLLDSARYDSVQPLGQGAFGEAHLSRACRRPPLPPEYRRQWRACST